MRILGTGSALPINEVPNTAFSAVVDTSDEWISTRTGILSRRIATDETALSLAREASERALTASGVSRGDIALVICATVTNETLTPSLACLLQRELNLRESILAFDINAACTGFIYSLALASSLLRQGERALLVGCEVLSRVTDFTDRATCVLFGDGAGAVIAEGSDSAFHFVSGARGDEALVIGSVPPAPNPFDAGKASRASLTPPVIRMNGQEVFRFAVDAMVKSIRDVAARAGESIADIDHFVCHQANRRIIESAAKRLGAPLDRFFLNIEHRGNTSAASVPIALDELYATGKLRRSDRIILAGFGGGLTYGAVYMRW